jgi:predicted dehydrogenase
MRFALLGDHPDGVELACALAESGRHQVVAHTAPVAEDVLRRWGGAAHKIADPEEVLADPAVEAVIVAGSMTVRRDQLRRALQSERHVLCVWPPDQTPEVAYEAAMLQQDTGCVLLPILPEAFHPGIRRLAEFVRRAPDAASSPVGSFRLLEVERAVPEEVLDGVWVPGQKPSFPGWDVLRVLGGEIQEVSAFAEREELAEGEPVLVAGRFERGGLFQVTLLPRQPAAMWRLTVVGTAGRAELLFPLGWQGPAFLDWRDEAGEILEEDWQRWDPWPALVEVFEEAVGRRPATPLPEHLRTAVTAPGPRTSDHPPVDGRDRPPLTWQDAVRALELDDAARRSVERRRSSVLEYPEATEEVGFKGTMTLVGCGMLWAILLLLILSRWWPILGWLIVPLLVVFLVLQFLRYAIPGPRAAGGGKTPAGQRHGPPPRPAR